MLIICVINGGVVGYGMDLVFGCDIWLMVDMVKLVFVFCKCGVLFEFGGIWYLLRLIGWFKVVEIIFMGWILLVEECVMFGLLLWIVVVVELMFEMNMLVCEIVDNVFLVV